MFNQCPPPPQQRATRLPVKLEKKIKYMVFYLIWNEETLVIKISRKIPFSEEKGVTLGQVIENWFRFDKLHSVLRGCSSSTLRAAYTDKEDHTAHTAMDNLHHAIKYLGK